MTYLLGMDLFVFIAWIGTILAAIFCVIYGIYHELFKKSNDTNLKHKKNNKKSKKEA